MTATHNMSFTQFDRFEEEPQFADAFLRLERHTKLQHARHALVNLPDLKCVIERIERVAVFELLSHNRPTAKAAPPADWCFIEANSDRELPGPRISAENPVGWSFPWRNVRMHWNDRAEGAHFSLASWFERYDLFLGEFSEAWPRWADRGLKRLTLSGRQDPVPMPSLKHDGPLPDHPSPLVYSAKLDMGPWLQFVEFRHDNHRYEMQVRPDAETERVFLARQFVWAPQQIVEAIDRALSI